MKKLDVTKILVLATISVGLVACGTTQTATDATSQDSSTLKSVPRNEGGGQFSDEGGGQQEAKPTVKNRTQVESEMNPVDEGGGQMAAPSDNEVEEGGGQMAAPSDKEVEEGGGQMAAPSDKEVEEGDRQSTKPIFPLGVAAKIEPTDEGGGQLHVELYGNVVVIQGTVQEKGQTASIILNGREFIEVQTDGLNFGAKFELEEDELKKGLNIQVVINKVVTNYYVTPEGAKLLTFK